jgi:hypothetical protein
MTTALADLVSRLKSAGRIAADDVLALRREVYGPPQVAQDDVLALIELDGAAHDAAPEWAVFVGDAMVDFIVHQEDPEDFVDDAKANWLMQACAGASGPGVAEALVRVTETATGEPPALSAFVLGKVKAAVIAGGKLDGAAVGLVRRTVFAEAGEDNIGVTREEADALFDIDLACGADADPAWAEFFAGAIDDALTAVSPFHLESREDAARDKAWLASRPSLFDFFKQVPHKPDLGGAWQDVFDPSATERNEWRDADARMDADEAAAATITDEKAGWLMGRLGEGRITAAGHALVMRLKAQMGDGAAALKPLFDAA